MPQILLLVIVLIIRLAVEGVKEGTSYKTGSFTRRPMNEPKRSNFQPKGTSHVSSRPTLDQTINQQSSGTAYKAPTKTTTSNNEYDHFENYDTDDYESFTQDECYEENGHFVDNQIKTYNSYDMRANKIKFMIFALVYCMWEDDNEITRKEKRMFKTISRVVSMNLSDKDTNEVKSFLDKRIDLDDVVHKQREYQLDINDVVETMASLRKQLKKEKQYNEILEIIENRFRFEL